MGLFSRSACAICGGKATLLGNLKLADGEVCRKCADEFSPYLADRKNLTVDQVREHMESRRANAQELSTFNATRVFGTNQKMYVDETNQRFLITYRNDWKDNPDIIYFSQVLSCDADISEHVRTENPGPDAKPGDPRPEIREYEFDVVIRVNHPWFNLIRFNLSAHDVPDIYSDEYYDLACDSVMIHNLLMPDYPMEMPIRQLRPVPPPPPAPRPMAPVPPMDNGSRPAGGPGRQNAPQGGMNRGTNGPDHASPRPGAQQSRPQGFSAGQPNRPQGMNNGQPDRPMGQNGARPGAFAEKSTAQPGRPMGQSGARTNVSIEKNSAQSGRPAGQNSAQPSRPTNRDSARPGPQARPQQTAHTEEHKPASNPGRTGFGHR